MHPYLRPFSAILLDLNGTFMFGHDRFGADQDYHATYRELGGRRLGRARLQGVVLAALERLDRRYRDERYFDRFPSVAAVLCEVADDLADEEPRLVEGVIAAHECGRVGERHAAIIGRLASTHRLGLVSNIWSGKARYVRELERAGILDRFGAIAFSSDGASIKPSPALFRQVTRKLGVASDEAVVVGDSLRCDVGGAAAAGLASIWIDAAGKGVPRGARAPDRTIRDLGDLVPDPHGPTA